MANLKNPNMFPRVCFVGPMLGKNPGWVVTQGEVLADLFSKEGYSVLRTSHVPYRLGRLGDIVWSLIKWRHSYDLVNLSVFSGRAFVIVDLVSLLISYLQKPLISVLRGGDLARFSDRYPKWVRRVLLRSHRLVAPSGFLAHHFQGWGLDVVVIPNVLNIENYPYKHRDRIKPRLLWMRTFHEIYYPEMAVEVLSKLRGTYPDIHLTMAGQDKGLQQAVQGMVAQRGLQDLVTFPGFLDHFGKKREFAYHDIYLHTNRIDNMPVSVIEAAAFGLPIVATSVGGIPDLLHDGVTALLVESEDISGMVTAIELLLNNPNLSAQLSSNGRLLVETFSWSQIKPQWEELISEVAQ